MPEQNRQDSAITTVGPAKGIDYVSTHTSAGQLNIADAGPTALEVFLVWEKLRIIYNSIMLIGTFYVVFPVAERVAGVEIHIENAGEMINVFLMWNICYCVVPIGEGYCRLLGIPRYVSRWMLFITIVFAMSIAGSPH